MKSLLELLIGSGWSTMLLLLWCLWQEYRVLRYRSRNLHLLRMLDNLLRMRGVADEELRSIRDKLEERYG